MKNLVVPYVQIQPNEELKQTLNNLYKQYEEMPTLATEVPGMPIIDLAKYTAQEAVTVEVFDIMNPYPLAFAACEGANEYNRTARNKPLLQVGDLLHLRDYDHWVVVMPEGEFAWVDDEKLKQYEDIEAMQFPHALLDFIEINQPGLTRALFRSLLLQMMTDLDIAQFLITKGKDVSRYEGRLEALTHLKTSLLGSVQEYLDGQMGKGGY